MKRRFIISSEQLNKPRPYIDGPDAHHLRVVLRSKPGDWIDVLDGRGKAYRARVVELEQGRVYIALESALPEPPGGIPEIILAQGYLKDKKMDDLVRPLTELGIARWVPVMARRSIPAPDDKRLQSRYARWQKISLEAVKQCGRRRPMTIDPPTSLVEALKKAGSCDVKLVFWEGLSESDNAPLSPVAEPKSVFALVGPEGGFDQDEVELALQAGFVAKSMGPRILRAETAALAAAVLLQSIFGDMPKIVLDNPQSV